MHSRLLLCLCVLGVVSAADEQTQGHHPDFITSQNGSTSESDFGASVATNSVVEVLPNGFEKSQDSEISGSSESSISIPVVKNENTSFKGYVNRLIPVPVYSSNGTFPTKDYSNPQNSNKRPVPDLFKVLNEFYPSPTKNPSQFDLHTNNNLGNPYKEFSSSFRLWPKLPDPIPVPVQNANSFVKSSYKKLDTNLVPQHLQKVQVPVKVYPSIIKKYQEQDLASVKYPSNLPIPSQANQPQPVNQGPIYFLVPGNNGQPSTYQLASQTQGSYYPQTPQGNQGLIIIAPRNFQQSVPSQAYQNNGYSSNQAYFGSQPQNNGYSNYSPLAQSYNAQGSQSTGQGGQTPFNFPFATYNAPGSQVGNSGGQPPVNFVLLAPLNSQGNQASSNAGGQPTLIYAPLSNSQGSQSANFANQPPLNFAVVASPNNPASPPQVSSPSQQNSLKHALFGTANVPQNVNAHKNVNVAIIPPTNDGQAIGAPNAPGQVPYVLYPSNFQGGLNNPSPTPSPQQNVGFSSTPSPFQRFDVFPQSTPQNGYSATPTPQSFGYSSTPAPPQNGGYSPFQVPPQFSGYPPTPAPPQFAGYPPAPALPQFAGYSPTPTPPQYSSYSPTQAPLLYASYPATQPPPQYPSYSPTQGNPQFTGYSPTQAPPQFAGYSPTQASPQYSNFSPTQGPPQYVGYSSTQAPPQFFNFSPSQAPPQVAGYSSTLAPPQFGYSSTPAPQLAGYSPTQTPQNFGFTPAPTAQPGFSQPPVSSVSFATPGSSYSYSVK